MNEYVNRMVAWFQSWDLAGRLERDRGATAVEYALIIGLIAVIIALTIPFLGTAISGRFTAACRAIGGPNAACAP
ncbi:Flp family type IVb pilin [Plantactinospora siamensis]|uniref:Flp family type IVb pilin n=1 Tax=Plantactinospora siamensis TaxID=555372 RepID=A0ABV6NQG3_9ACTN